MLEKLKNIGNENICPSAVIIRDGKVLLGYRHYTTDKWKPISVWTCPGGRCDNGESIETTLRREVREETGIADLKIIDHIGEFSGAKEGDIVPLFLCRTDQEPALMEPNKFSSWHWFGADDFPKDFINNRARPSILGLLLK